MNTARRLAVLAVLLIAAIARGQSAQGPDIHRVQIPADAAWSQLMATMQKMHADMSSVNPSGDSDSDFVRLMLPHHQAALDMAKTQLIYGKDPQLRRLAQEIVADQQSEIDLMQLWLTHHPPGSPKPDQTPVLHASKEQSR